MSYPRPPYVPENLTRYDTYRTKEIYGGVLHTRWQDPQGNLITYPSASVAQVSGVEAEEFLPTGYRRWF